MANKTVIITGASSGIGLSIANHLSNQGYTVIGTSRKPSKQHLSFEMAMLDVNQESSVASFTDEVFGKHGKVDVLINNAGFGLAGPLEDFSIDEAKQQFETNYFGVVRMNNAFLPRLRKQGHGVIINVGSMAGIIGLPFQGHYSASKFALEGYLAALRMELLPFNIQVFNINPGDFATGFTANRQKIGKISSQYQDKFNQLLSMYERDETNGANPLIIARKIEKLIRNPRKKYRIRYVVGKFDQTIAIPLKRIVGDTAFERLMRVFWNI